MLFYLSLPYLWPTSTLVTHVCSMQLINVAQASLSQVKNTLASLPMHFTRFHQQIIGTRKHSKVGRGIQEQRVFSQ